MAIAELTRPTGRIGHIRDSVQGLVQELADHVHIAKPRRSILPRATRLTAVAVVALIAA